MPTYPYACTACDNRFEAVQSFSDEALTECPKCGGRLRKVFSSVGVVFKGSGFYRNDSRGTGNGSKPAGDSGSTGSGSKDGGKDSGSGGGSDKPAPTSTPAVSTPASGSSGSATSGSGSKGSTSAA